MPLTRSPKVPASPPSHEINSPANLTFPCHPDRAPGWRELPRLIYCAHPGHRHWAESRLGPHPHPLLSVDASCAARHRRTGFPPGGAAGNPVELNSRAAWTRSDDTCEVVRPGPSVFPRRVRWTAGRGGEGVTSTSNACLSSTPPVLVPRSDVGGAGECFCSMSEPASNPKT